MRHRLGDRLLGDCVEDDTLDLDVLQHLLFVENFQHMPGNRLTFAIRVGGEYQAVGALDGGGYFVEALLGFDVDVPGHGEVFVRQDRAILGGQVADMAVGGQDLVALAEVLVDRFRLGRRLDNDDVHRTLELSL